MKICFLAGANSIHSYRWIKYFADKGHNIHWISCVPLDFDYIENITFYEIKQFPIRGLSLLYSAFKIKKLIKNINPDILHAHYIGTYGLIAAMSGYNPLILTAWGSDILFAGKSKLKGPFVKYALNKADLITCDAIYMIDAMMKLSTDKEKIKLIFFGVDTDKFKPGEKNLKLRENLKLDDSPTIISLRNLEPVYDVETLIKAIPLVLKEIPEAKFIIGGTGSEGKRLNELSKSLGVTESVRFIGRYSNDALPQYLASADIYVSTSLSDAGIAASTAEAMACGIPVVITDSGENREWVKDGGNGFVVPVSDPVLIAEKILLLLQNDTLREKIGMEGQKTIRERNNYHREMGKMEEIYERLIKTR
jgi:glycosyltransferase involved in cell wall biosynthesis